METFIESTYGHIRTYQKYRQKYKHKKHGHTHTQSRVHTLDHTCTRPQTHMYARTNVCMYKKIFGRNKDVWE